MSMEWIKNTFGKKLNILFPFYDFKKFASEQKEPLVIQDVQAQTDPVKVVRGRCSSCGREGLCTFVGTSVVGQGQGILDYIMNRIWVCTGCHRVFCPSCSHDKYDFKCPTCGRQISSD